MGNLIQRLVVLLLAVGTGAAALTYLPLDSFQWETAPLSSLSSPAAAVALYLIVVFALDAAKPSHDTRPIQAVHNAILCAWSTIMFLGSVVALAQRARGEGVTFIFCESPMQPAVGATYFWSYVYYISKFYELLDTVLQLLKGRRPPFFALHVYHHAVVVFMAWWWIEYRQSLHPIGLCFNSFVHIPMYYFYYLRARGRDVWWKRYITQLQIVQFAFSLLCLLPTGVLLLQGATCAGMVPLLLNLAFNVSLLVQFVGVYSFNAKNKRQ